METAHDHKLSLIEEKLKGVVSTASSTAKEIVLHNAVDFHLTYCDGQAYEFDAPGNGWARAQRLPAERVTPAQIEFVWECYQLKQTDQALKPFVGAPIVILSISPGCSP